jgi:hypothetical protein
LSSEALETPKGSVRGELQGVQFLETLFASKRHQKTTLVRADGVTALARQRPLL